MFPMPPLGNLVLVILRGRLAGTPLARPTPRSLVFVFIVTFAEMVIGEDGGLGSPCCSGPLVLPFSLGYFWFSWFSV